MAARGPDRAVGHVHAGGHGVVQVTVHRMPVSGLRRRVAQARQAVLQGVGDLVQQPAWTDLTMLAGPRLDQEVLAEDDDSAPLLPPDAAVLLAIAVERNVEGGSITRLGKRLTDRPGFD